MQDTNGDETRHGVGQLKIESDAQQQKLTKEEELLRERMRARAEGITSYEVHEDTAVISKGHSLYLYDMSTRELSDLTAIHEQQWQHLGDQMPGKEVVKQPKMDAKFSPDGELITFTCEGDLYVFHVESAIIHRLTYASTTPGFSAGVADFIQSEEFDRYTGYWWCPHVATLDGQKRYRIVYVVTDETAIPALNISGTCFDRDVETYRYPRAGDANAKHSLRVLDFSLRFADQRERVELVNANDRPVVLPQELLSWTEYIVRVGWLEPSQNDRDSVLWAQVLDRLQQRTAYIAVNADSMRCELVSEQFCQPFLNVTGTFYTFSNNPNFAIIGSEFDGFHHLYLHERDEQGRWVLRRQLTSGRWQVNYGDQIFVDEAKGLVYFTGTKDSPLENHLYVLSLNDSSGAVHRLTPTGYYFSSVAFNSDKSMFVANFSNISKPHRCMIFKKKNVDPSGSSSGVPQFESCVEIDFSFADQNSGGAASVALTQPVLHSYTTSRGDTTYAAIYTPPNYDASHADGYPCIHYVYGGPGVQLVTNQYSMKLNGRVQLFTQLGFVCVVVDGRGSKRRGLAWEHHLYGRLGLFELDDAVETITGLTKKKIVNIDLNRVGIYGFSYGGSLALWSQVLHPSFYKAACAGAPVTDWRLYDTGYSERYLGVPQGNGSAYKSTSLLEVADQFPDEDDRILLVHGEKDENVHFRHTEALISKLMDHLKPYRLALFPQERHGMRRTEASMYYQKIMSEFFIKNLLAKPSTKRN